ncbi:MULTISPECIES: hypothetical protein [unclassified Leucobacter]|uniref:hypothetical protein n=1 Tax=unclassified Leucobacter TaxID=2621730 RepID=UPI000621C5CC|nr:hypothetical protein [Leucobacter sp. Ag1]KKI16389.1 hypothetical protein XM48_16485 [Leucobacter sp. Ag1]
MTAEEIRRAVQSLRNVGGVYEYVAACVEHDNRPRLSVAVEAASGARLLPDTDPSETRRQWTSWIAYQAADPDQRAKFPIFASVAAEIRIEAAP